LALDDETRIVAKQSQFKVDVPLDDVRLREYPELRLDLAEFLDDQAAIKEALLQMETPIRTDEADPLQTIVDNPDFYQRVKYEIVARRTKKKRVSKSSSGAILFNIRSKISSIFREQGFETEESDVLLVNLIKSPGLDQTMLVASIKKGIGRRKKCHNRDLSG